MKFSSDSENLMDNFMQYFKKYLKKKNPYQQRGFDKVMKKFFTEIKASEKNVDKLFKNNKVRVKITEVNDFFKVDHSSLITSSLIPIEILTYIKNNIVGLVEYKTKIKTREITLYFYLTMGKHFNELKRFELLAYRMFLWLDFISNYTTRKCFKTLKTYIYLTPLKKYLPDSQFTVLSSLHANTGITTSCARDGEICLFREEEVFKVFIHETFHALGLDFSTMSTTILDKKIQKLFPINSEFNLYEAYTEFWACIMNCIFTSYYLSERKVKDFLIYSEFCIAFEEYFAIFQCLKILKFMGLSYNYLHENSDIGKQARKYLYKEQTNIFAYYIIKMILLFNNYYFIMWCKRNNTNIMNFNKNRVNLNKFYNFIANHYKEKNIVNALLNVEEEMRLLKHKNIHNKSNIFKTLRMTIVELI